MKILIINGLNFPKNINQYNEIFSINYLNYNILKKKIKNIKCLTSLKPNNDNRLKFHNLLKKNLLLETKDFKNRWAYLSKDYVLWRFLQILYYKELIKKIFVKGKKISITLSSKKNLDLVLAVKSLSSEYNLKIKYLNYDSMPQTSPHKFGGPYDLVNGYFLASDLTIKVLSKIISIFNISKGFYFKYPNLNNFRNFLVFRDFLAITFSFRSILNKIRSFFFNLKNEPNKINLDQTIDYKNNLFKRENWREFNNVDFTILNSIYKSFTKKCYDFQTIDKIFNKYYIFFQNSKINEFVFDQDNSIRSKLIIFTLQKLKIKSSFYFHGYSDDKFWFGKYFKRNIYDVEKIYTWSKCSKKFLSKKFRNNCEFVPHNKFKKKIILKKKFKISKNSKVLVLGSSWTNMSFLNYDDCFERTIIDTVSVLNSLNINKIDLKIKPVENFFYKNYYQVIKIIKAKLNLKFELIKNDLNEDFFNSYDLIICDKTTGLFESFASNTHTITYVGNFTESKFVEHKNLRICKNYKDLKKSIININNITNSYYQKIYDSLVMR